ncbi:hypothetical protein GCM10010266_57960 [Streptomyces griseomycini]|uniref:UDP:flavonoid glycosyltransferase YjiC (YdhE family) n=1 Tax=Streptomyces griseomycini TaxID=66895 RepID=A0A7W7VA02_9ACTN|nr:UDP:flavonoid glycosyltransferase YjiC (YdhE family) [Streptomyces griseomycini]GGQ27115.1 hypothetical protein GCM10010266_57960 [Streptomyces griseomycini]GGR46171.1 hypothetical protein GCM10015536_59970 [Streptomyces griseomycini]
MVGVPVVSHGLPSLALIRELVARGHRVTYANDPSVADRIQSAGAELVPCTTTDVDASSGPPARALALIPRAMQPHAGRVGTDTGAFGGPCFGTRADTDGWTRPAAADNVLLISLGSAHTRRPAFHRRCIAAFGDLPGWHVVLQTGKHTGPEELGAIPPNNAPLNSVHSANNQPSPHSTRRRAFHAP